MSGSQTIGVDSVAPTLSVDTLAQDNIINAAEHSQPLTLTGKTTAEAGQIVTVTLNGKTTTPRWAATVPVRHACCGRRAGAQRG